jgi:ADP-ribosylglycohydrolase
MKKEYLERIYAGWLAKIIGIRYGAPVEGWTYEKIKNIYGELTDYPVDYREFAADDDSNGPLFYLRGLEDGGHGAEMTAQDVANALLNYAPYEHGFFWWGGYGTSTEHTAYLNLRNGIPAPRSGSIAQNGSTIAEQIGGQIFIDTWGLVAPGNPALAAKLASKAASVTHDGNALYGGIFVAVCISIAFEEKEIKKILETGLSYIPSDCEYAKIVRTVMEFYEEHPQNWRDCFAYIHANYGYDKYPGNCHIIPNIAVMVLALLYGNGDFSDTIAIVTMCGWDTDCNGGNVATIIGVRNGLEGIDYDRWRKPVHDLLVCSSVIGSLNIMDIPYGALYIGKMAYELAGEELPEPWKSLQRKEFTAVILNSRALRIPCRFGWTA